MRRILFAVTVATVLALAVTAAIAQTPIDSSESGSSDPPLFHWAFETGGFNDNWDEGLALALLGLAGALAAVYFLLGDFLPAMGGKAEYEAGLTDVEEKKQRRDSLNLRREELSIHSEDDDWVARESALGSQVADLDGVIDREQKRLSTLRWRLWFIGMPIFVLLGALTATAITDTAIEAIVVGFGWTAVADRFGLRRENEVKKERRQEVTQQFFETAASTTRTLTEARNEARKLRSELELKDATIRTMASRLRPATPSETGD